MGCRAKIEPIAGGGWNRGQHHRLVDGTSSPQWESMAIESITPPLICLRSSVA